MQAPAILLVADMDDRWLCITLPRKIDGQSVAGRRFDKMRCSAFPKLLHSCLIRGMIYASSAKCRKPTLFLKEIAKRLIALTPFRIIRGAPNRYQAIGYSLRHLHRRGYEPKQIIDGGAHLGSFALEATTIFAAANVHMIDPQPACRAPLEALAAERGFIYHPYALSSAPGILPMNCAEFPNTGALLGSWPVGPGQKAVDVEATTLDCLFSATSKMSDRTLLKLDLQGHEMPALEGGLRMLKFVEVILVEVPFFGEVGQPTVPDIISFFRKNGFDLFDVASLSGRPRDNRLREGDFVFVRQGSPISADGAWS